MKRRIILSLIGASAISAFADYGINYPADTDIASNGNRCLSAVEWNASPLAAQILEVGQQPAGRLYIDRTTKCLIATRGAEVNVNFRWNGTWMNSYVYIDRDNDGEFNPTLTSAGRPDPDGDIFAFSHLNGINSAGASFGSGNNMVLPGFSLGNMATGLYRVRFKVDWDSADPAGNNSDNNNIIRNAGAITDTYLRIIEPLASAADIEIGGEHGTVTTTINGNGTMTINASPDNGFVFDGVYVSNDFGLPEGMTLADSSLESRVFPTLESSVTIPSSILTSCTRIEAIFTEEASRTDDYSYDSPYTGDIDANDGITSLTFNGQTIAVSSTKAHRFTDEAVNLTIGSPFTMDATGAANATSFNVYVDHKRLGYFSEPLASGSTLAAIGEMKLPARTAPGVYRARLEAAGVCDVDFLINVSNPAAAFRPRALNGIILTADGSAMADSYPTLTPLTITVAPTLPGFETDHVIVRHGQNLGGREYVKGNRQWADTSLPVTDGKVTIPAEVINGDVDVYALFTESDNSEWTKIWGDEFNSGPIDSNRWQYQPRQNATWNMRVANTPAQQALVNKIEDGCYSSWCIATPQEIKDAGETIPMISGAIISSGKFSTVYGKIEARIKTTNHTGNFPAFWMMPAYSELHDLGLAGWPNDGEIDIWESIDADNRAYATVHSGWTGWNNYNHWPTGPVQSSPRSSGDVANDNDLWHVYAVEWDEEQLRFFIDGKQIFAYNNMHYSEAGSPYYVEKVTWPFDKEFYIILNQSVGNGAWARPADTSFDYNTKFDYVRVYQKRGGKFTTSITGNGDDPDFYIPATGNPEQGAIEQVTVGDSDRNADGPAEFFDLNGRKIKSAAAMPAGIYIERRGTSAKKIIVK